jgi:hypothetical protein
VPTKISLPALPTLIQKLLEEREQHADALTRIDEVLAGVGAALGGFAAPKANGRAVAAPTAKTPTAKKRGKRTKFAVSAEASILAFVKEHKNPTSQEITKHWQDQGRSGRADNTLSLMVKNKKLKRTPLGKGIRGSRFTLV